MGYDLVMKDWVSCLPVISRDAPARITTAIISGAFLLFASGIAHGDELKTVSGERLIGKTVSVNDATIVFSSATVGKVTVARSNVLALTFTSSPAPNAAAKTNVATHTDAERNSEIAAVLRTLPAQPGLAENVSSDMLAQAGPEATEKFNQMLRGLLTGKMSVADLRAEAQSVRDQARAIRADLGDEAGVLDGYLSILDKFLGQTPPPQNTAKTPSK
jgi:hypothetical protein